MSWDDVKRPGQRLTHDDWNDMVQFVKGIEGGIKSGDFIPTEDASFDIGASGARWKDGWFSGNVTAAEPILGDHLATKEYVDKAVAGISLTFWVLDSTDPDSDYYKTQITPPDGSQVTWSFTSVSDGQLLFSIISPSDFPFDELLHGLYESIITVKKTGGTKDLRLYWEMYERKSDDTEILIETSALSDDLPLNSQTVAAPALLLSERYVLEPGSRMVAKVYASVSGSGNNPSLEVYVQGNTSTSFKIPTNIEVLDHIFAADDHTHDASDITSGVLSAARIPDLSRSKITDFFDSPFWDDIPDKPSTFPSDEDLAIYLPFIEGYGSVVHDVSSSGNHGTINGATWTVGRYGHALSFDGDDYVEVSDSESLNFGTESFTLITWLYPTKQDAGQNIIYKGGRTDVAGYRLTIEPSNVFACRVSDGTNFLMVTSNSEVSYNTWNFVAFVWDANAQTVKLYINGVLDAQQSGTVGNITNTLDLHIGGYGTWFYEGIIDEVRIYSRALSPEEIKALYYSSLGIRREHVTSVMGVLDSDVLLTTDNAYDSGSPTARWANIYCVTLHQGDSVFANGWKITEAEKLGLGEGLVLVSPDGKVYKFVLEEVS